MEVNQEIYKKARNINTDNYKKSQYLYECEQAGLCPKCGEKVSSKMTGGWWAFFIYTCKNCGRIYY